MERRDFDEFRRQMRAFPARQIAAVFFAAVGVVLLLWGLLSSYYTVEANEVGIVRRFGRYTGSPEPPGLHFKLPFIDQVDNVPVNFVKTLEFGFRTAEVPDRGRTRYEAAADGDDTRLMLTGDQNVVSVEWIVQYRINDPAQYLFRIKGPEDTINDVSEAAMRLVVGDSSATEVLTERRAEIAGEVKDRLQATLDAYEAGIDVVAVQLQDIKPPEKVVASFNEVNRAQQDQEKAYNEANKEYNSAIPQAQGEALRILEEAQGFRVKRVNEAKGDVAKFEKLLAAYRDSKEVTRQRLYFEAIESVLPRLTRIYVVDGETRAPLPILDLEEAAGAARPAAEAASPPRGARRAAGGEPGAQDPQGTRSPQGTRGN
jgi:membrane protease subunit HflK